MIALTYTANWLFDSQSPTHRRPVADQSPTSCRPFTTYFQSVGNQSPTSRRPIADWSSIFRDSCRRPVADWSATGKRSFWSHIGCIGCSCFLVARQSPTGCSTCVTGALTGSFYKDKWAPPQYKDDLSGMGISSLKIRRSWDHPFIFITGIPILLRHNPFYQGSILGSVLTWTRRVAT